jgi:hypothetical protein
VVVNECVVCKKSVVSWLRERRRAEEGGMKKSVKERRQVFAEWVKLAGRSPFNWKLKLKYIIITVISFHVVGSMPS